MTMRVGGERVIHASSQHSRLLSGLEGTARVWLGSRTIQGITSPLESRGGLPIRWTTTLHPISSSPDRKIRISSYNFYTVLFVFVRRDQGYCACPKMQERQETFPALGREPYVSKSQPHTQERAKTGFISPEHIVGSPCLGGPNDRSVLQ
ncbi:hypothetical protein J6590_038504 [Homalodisca vitripennis]|nr:hypothetical protein J6590_038504 [Homalodisca vitripennis]